MAGSGKAHLRDEADTILRVEDLNVEFPAGRGRTVYAVSGISFDIAKGETLGLVGESGSGKTTVARAILRFINPESGSIRLGDFDVTGFGRSTPLEYRKAVQVVFQDPVGSLNPSMVVGDIVGEPLAIHLGLKGEAARERAAELMDQVGLQEHHLDRYPYEFSGGQRQRIAIARALAASPDLLVLDEPVSALDVSTQSQVINLLEELQRKTGVAFLFIAHDLSVVRHISDRIVVMYLGRVAEIADSADLYTSPAHPYSHALLSAVPVPDPDIERERERIVLQGDIPSPSCAVPR